MSFAGRFAHQLAHPAGLAGRLLGNVMDVVNRRPMRLAVDLLAPRAGEAILDAGCGSGIAMAEILARADCALTGADRSAAMIDAARRRLGRRARYVLGALENLPLGCGGQDAVLALNVLYFDQPERPMLYALRAALRPGGRLVAYVTHRETMQDWAFVGAGLHQLYDAGELHSTFVEAGFAPEHVEVHEVAITSSVRGLLACAKA